ncbi:hypothetical protein HDA40_002916 [Hamadaea flava]|uniref:Cyclic nucleotide-binding domain-containing protein n=1 Tax=Hamadaea flava TaxID=1742688 RepID=A0ABV8LZF1_9ACTN|nr:hypothetical protein [Hamadaea flava]MCP2324409.1 hypothetical protein [Hamadaea flava]
MREPSALEVVVRLGSEAIIRTDTEDGGPPMLWVRSGLMEIMLTPFAASEGGELTKADLELASDLVVAVVAYRDAIYDHLVSTGAVQKPVTRRMRRPRGHPTPDA